MLSQTEPQSQMSIRQQEMKLCLFFFGSNVEWINSDLLFYFPQRTEQGHSADVYLSDVTLTHNNSQIDTEDDNEWWNTTETLTKYVG